MYGAAAMGVAGLGLSLAGMGLSAGEASKKRKEVQKIADTPGIDTGALTGQALADQLRYLPQGTELAKRISEANQAQIQAQEEMSMPGVGAARGEALAAARGLFADDAEWLKGVQRRGSALGLSSGLRGSSAGQRQTLRMSDQESMQRKQLGTSLLGSLIGSMRIANSPGVQAFLGPNPSDLINIRSAERAQRMNILMQRAGMQTSTDVWAGGMQQMGGALMGAGMMGLGGGGMGGGSTGATMSAAPTTTWGVNPNTYGTAQGMLGIR